MTDENVQKSVAKNVQNQTALDIKEDGCALSPIHIE
jgi:hypothetical protein